MHRRFGGHAILCDLRQGQKQLVVEHQNDALIETEIRCGSRIHMRVSLSLGPYEMLDVFANCRVLDRIGTEDLTNLRSDCNFSVLHHVQDGINTVLVNHRR
jgi:hypothetical protein